MRRRPGIQGLQRDAAALVRCRGRERKRTKNLMRPGARLGQHSSAGVPRPAHTQPARPGARYRVPASGRPHARPHGILSAPHLSPPPPPSPPQNRFRAVGADVAEARAETLKATLASFKDKLDAFAHAHR